MPLSSLTETALSRLGLEVPLPKIDRALKELWEADDAKTRASLINFAIYSEDISSVERNNELLDHITADHACRALLIVSLPNIKPPRARAWINALCRPYQGKKVVCSEQISFILEGGDESQMQNIVFAHLDSDLPLFMWWQGPLSSNFKERLYSRIDTLIIDSSSWEDPVAAFAQLAMARGDAPHMFDVRDLSWTRSHFMRTALANCFQDSKAREHLPQLSSIEVTFAKGHRCAAIMLGAWVAMRVGAVLAEDQPGLKFTKPEGGQIEVLLKQTTDGCALQSLRLMGVGLEACITRDGTSPFVHTCATCEGHVHEEVLPADVVSDAELISEQLSRAGGNTHLAALLPIMAKMVQEAAD